MKSGFRAAAVLGLMALLSPSAAHAQENPAKRLASIVSVAMEEYGRAVDDRGRLISELEYEETTSFLGDARGIAGRLRGYNAHASQALLDTLAAAVNARRPPAEVRLIHARFRGALGAAGALDLPQMPLDIARGRALYSANCASCHGVSGLGDGPAAASLSVLPPAVGDRDKTPDLSPTLAYNVVTVGVSATPMPAFGDELTPQDRWDIVNYLYELRGQPMELPAAADVTALPAEAAAHSILALLDSAVGFARLGRIDEAGDRAFDAYIAFEPLETRAGAKQPGLIANMERHFADFRAAVKKADIQAAEGARNSIALDLPRVVDLSQPTGEGLVAFFQSLLIIVREGLEAILVVGAVVALLIKTGHRERLRSIWIGVGAGILASAVTAVLLKTMFAWLPASREIVEGVSMLLAVVVLFSVSYWLISKIEAEKWQQFIRERVNAALEHGGGRALAFVSFLAVYREGAETALFYQALFSEGGNVMALSMGILVGSAVLALVFTLFYRYGVRIPMRSFFAITSVLLYYMAFVFLGKGIRELQEGNVVGITVLPHLPHVPAMGIFPSVETTLAQIVLVGLFVFALLRTFLPRPEREGEPTTA